MAKVIYKEPNGYFNEDMKKFIKEYDKQQAAKAKEAAKKMPKAK